MIPIVSILSAVSALLSFFICFRLWRRFQTLGNLVMYHFAACYFFFGLFFIFFAAPGILHTDLTIIAVDAAIAYLALFVTIAYFIQIPVEISWPFVWARLLFWITLITGVILFAANIFYLELPLKISQGYFIYYLVRANPLIQLLNVFIPLVFDFIGIIFLISQGYYSTKQENDNQLGQAKSSTVAYRSYQIAVGWAIIMVAGILNIYGSSPIPHPGAIFLATLAAVVGLLVVFRGISK